MKQAEIFNYNTRFSTSIDNFYSSSTAESMVTGDNGILPVCYEDPNAETIDNGKYSIYDVADWFLLKEQMTHAKLQKLCYYAQAWFYALRDKRLADTDFQAWVQGPVSPALFDRFKGFGYETIKITCNFNPPIQKEDLDLLNDVWDTYGDKTGNALEALSNRELPWLEARRGYGVRDECLVVITPESMKRYYTSIYNR